MLPNIHKCGLEQNNKTQTPISFPIESSNLSDVSNKLKLHWLIYLLIPQTFIFANYILPLQ